MRFQRSTLLFLSALAASHAFAPMHQSAAARLATPLRVSVGIGPEKDEKEVVELVAGVDYEVPDHELYRQVRRSTIDEKCDDWFGNLLEGDSPGALGDAIIDKTRSVLMTPVELKNDVRIVVVPTFCKMRDIALLLLVDGKVALCVSEKFSSNNSLHSSFDSPNSSEKTQAKKDSRRTSTKSCHGNH